MTDIDRENAYALALVQAMVGAVSPNFRRVSIGVDKAAVRIQVVLERESVLDREEISDIEFEFEALQPSAVRVIQEIVVSAEPLEHIPVAGRVVYGRRESSDDPSAVEG